MRTRLHLKPGQKGTKQLLAQYGDRLVCVRYRYDAQRKKRFKTVELLVAECDWNRHGLASATTRSSGYASPLPTWQSATEAGWRDTWNPERRVWQLRYDRVVALGLHSRIVSEPASNSRCPGSSGENLHADARAPSK